ncbi:hypothetical protein B0H14DRAFT_3787342 [Mycena olivaceomarginata]|nr:hypothetical protein B0H14DRAFT_3787342 [Mycena olivaceomarginata]
MQFENNSGKLGGSWNAASIWVYGKKENGPCVTNGQRDFAAAVLLPHAAAAAAALQRQSAAVVLAAHAELLGTTRQSAAVWRHPNTCKHWAAAVGNTLQRQSWHFAAAVGVFSAALGHMLRHLCSCLRHSPTATQRQFSSTAAVQQHFSGSCAKDDLGDRLKLRYPIRRRPCTARAVQTARASKSIDGLVHGKYVKQSNEGQRDCRPPSIDVLALCVCPHVRGGSGAHRKAFRKGVGGGGWARTKYSPSKDKAAPIYTTRKQVQAGERKKGKERKKKLKSDQASRGLVTA